MDLHLIPGHFSEAAARLADGIGVQVEHVKPGMSQREQVDVPLLAGRSRPAIVEAFGGEPAGRVFVSISFAADVISEAMTIKDLEIGLMGLACAAMGGEEQGTVLIGEGLGPVGAGVPRGTLGEQTRALLTLHGEAAQVLVVCPGTSESLGDLGGYLKEPLGDLVTYRLM